MGCGGSKVDDLPLVALCRERRELVREAAEQRYALAGAHVSYFRAARGIGEALRRFVNEEVVVGGQPPGSPVVTIPSSEGKGKTPTPSSSASGKSVDSHLHLSDEEDGGASQESASPLHSEGGFSATPPQAAPSPPEMPGVTNFYYNYMRPSSTAVPAVVYEQPSPFYFGVPEGRPYDGGPAVPSPPSRAVPAAPPPPPPPVSPWDFLNVFSSDEGEYGYGYGYPRYGVGVGSDVSSPDSSKVREREGIPDLEDETESEPVKELSLRKGKKPEKWDKKADNGKVKMPEQRKSDGEGTSSGVGKEEKGENLKSSPGKGGSKSVEEDPEEEAEEAGRRKGVSFEVEASVAESVESLQTSGRTTLSSVQSRDIREVVEEIRDQFFVASDCGKEVALMLEAGKVRYRPRNPFLKVISCRILDDVAPSVLPSSRVSGPIRMGRNSQGDIGDSAVMKSRNLSSTLEKLCAWEKKLYKEVKDEEKLRVIYEKQCKRLKILDDRGAETYKIDATQAYIRKLLTKLSVAIKAIDTIASRIHKLRDEELHPQLIELFQGFMGMWKSMMKCHRRQFQSILESKSSTLIGKIRIRGDSSTRATMELEEELRSWCACFDRWISTQRAYIDALNGWLLKCLDHTPEVTSDGVVPFSPSRIGAPPVFILSNDWCSVMDRISKSDVTQAMQNFASRVHILWERQDEERRQKLKAEYLTRDLEKRLKSLQVNKDSLAQKVVSASNQETGDLALESLKRRLDEERTKHIETMKQVQEAVVGSIETGLVPIFEAMDKFSSALVRDIEGVRILRD